MPYPISLGVLVLVLFLVNIVRTEIASVIKSRNNKNNQSYLLIMTQEKLRENKNDNKDAAEKFLHWHQ
ncbi:MAG: hypothetical protein WA667_00620, partial [Candidatus Nitrosopolaris sp.]